MEIIEIKDKDTVHEFLLKDPYLHLYELGNLQESLFRHIRWHAAVEKGVIRAVSMLYISEKHTRPVYLLLENTNMDAAAALLRGTLAELPDNFFAHISKGLHKELEAVFQVSIPVPYDKMMIKGDILIDKNIRYPEYTYRINRDDFETVDGILRSVNPDAFFVPAMLRTGKYFCIRKNASLLSMAGVHFYSREIGVAAIGNVMTMPDDRGKGYAASVTASLCRDLWKEVKFIGLNVEIAQRRGANVS